jgi:hypothetical protein
MANRASGATTFLQAGAERNQGDQNDAGLLELFKILYKKSTNIHNIK